MSARAPALLRCYLFTYDNGRPVTDDNDERSLVNDILYVEWRPKGRAEIDAVKA